MLHEVGKPEADKDMVGDLRRGIIQRGEGGRAAGQVCTSLSDTKKMKETRS